MTHLAVQIRPIAATGEDAVERLDTEAARIVQAAWVVLSFLLARALWKSGVRHYQAVGG
jgi:ABC-type uncharacterized transport system permease subunit